MTCFVLLVILCEFYCMRNVFALSSVDKQTGRKLIKEMFIHSYEKYIIHAFPRDELRPLTCDGHNTLGGKRTGYALTLIDTLDALIVFEQYHELRRSVLWITHHWSPDIDENVSIFETNIRILGGLLSTHLFLANDRTLWSTAYDDDVCLQYAHHDSLNECQFDTLFTQRYCDTDSDSISNKNLICLRCDQSSSSYTFFDCFYYGQLLDLSIDLGERLLPAFKQSKTSIPFGTVNLRHGVPANETTIVCSACAGTFLLEFGILSLLTDRWDDFYSHAKLAATQLYHARHSETNLIGKHINNFNGAWTQIDCSLGTFVDSYLEYLLKAYFIFGDDDLLVMFNALWSSFWYHLNDKHGYNSTWYTQVRLDTGELTSIWHDTFASFFPGLLTLTGNMRLSTAYLDAMITGIVQRYAFMPESFDLHSYQPVPGHKQYFLRPEFVESLYYVYGVTRDEYYLDTAWELVKNINDTARVFCGFATINDIETHALHNSMDSFWMSETLKYFYLLFQTGNDENYFLFSDAKYKDMMFTTEGHMIPLNILHKIWNRKLRKNRRTKQEFWSVYHWWNIETFWPTLLLQLYNDDKFRFRVNRHSKSLNGTQKWNLLRNYFQYIENDQLLYSEYQRIFVRKETNPMYFDAEKLVEFQQYIYDAEEQPQKRRFYQKTFANKKYSDDWVQMGARTFWDCGQYENHQSKQNVKRWTLNTCDSYVHMKCWSHRHVDNSTCFYIL